MTSRFLYFDSAHAVGVHDWIIKNSGGRAGITNLDLIEGALEHVQNDLYYPNLVAKLTHLVFSVNKNHAFVDGNKRSSIALGAYFLQLNGYGYCVKRFVRRMENIVVEIAKNNIDKELAAEIIASILYEDDYSEVLKIKIAKAVGAE
jgi:death-on-curing protein